MLKVAKLKNPSHKNKKGLLCDKNDQEMSTDFLTFNTTGNGVADKIALGE